MNNEDFDLLESYMDGLLGQAQKEELESRLESNSELRETFQLLKNARGIVEAEQDLELLEIMQAVDAERNHPEKLEQDSSKSAKYRINKFWLLAIISAALLIIFLAIFKQTSDIDKTYIAGAYALDENGRTVRGSNSTNQDSLVEVTYTIPMREISAHIKKKEFSEAKSKINNLNPEFLIGQQNIEYTKALISYLENGRKDETFHQILNKILDDPTHNCYPLAVRLDSEVNSIWGRLID